MIEIARVRLIQVSRTQQQLFYDHFTKNFPIKFQLNQLTRVFLAMLILRLERFLNINVLIVDIVQWAFNVYALGISFQINMNPNVRSSQLTLVNCTPK